jgi:hypothetical protein
MKAALGSRFLGAALLAAGFFDVTMFHLPQKGISKIGNQFLTSLLPSGGNANGEKPSFAS